MNLCAFLAKYKYKIRAQLPTYITSSIPEIHCERKGINEDNTVNVIVPKSSILLLDESYRFCLVLVSQKNLNSELEVGCSNITKLRTNAQSIQFGKKKLERKLDSSLKPQGVAEKGGIETEVSSKAVNEEHNKPMQTKNSIYGLYGDIGNYLPGIYLGATVAIISLFLWGIGKIRKTPICGPTSLTRYSQSPIGPTVDNDRGSGYFKLQTTTTL